MKTTTLNVTEAVMVAIETIQVLQAHLSYLSARERSNLSTDLASRGIDIAAIIVTLGCIAREEDPRRTVTDRKATGGAP